MTYQEQLVIERLNRQIMLDILSNPGPEAFIAYYATHTQKETIERFNIRNIKQLKKILTACGYDFKTKKPSSLKGKPAARSHESYILGGQKSAETQQKHWQEKSAEEKEAWSQKQKLAHDSVEFREKISQINKDYRSKQNLELAAQQNKNRSKAMKQHIAALSADDFDTWVNKGFKKYTADGVFFDSFPELCFYLYHRSIGKVVFRNNKRLEYLYDGTKHCCYPDFEIDGKLFEIKGDHLLEAMIVPGSQAHAKYLCLLENDVKILASADYKIYEQWFNQNNLLKEDFLNE